MASKLNKLRRNVEVTNRTWERAVKRAFWMKNVTTVAMFVLTILNVCLSCLVLAGKAWPFRSSKPTGPALNEPIIAPSVKREALPEEVAELLSLHGAVSEGEYEDAVLKWFNVTYMNTNTFQPHNLKEDYHE